MAVFPSDQVTFFRIVEQTFLALKGSALMLSSRDSELVRGWEKTGVPVRVVCEAIVGSFEAYGRTKRGGQPLRSLSYCAPAVLEAIKTWKERQVGGHGSGPSGD